MDTLDASIKLKSSGFSDQQAKTLTEVMANNESIEIKIINVKIDTLDDKVDNLDDKFDNLDNKVEKLDNNIKDLQKNFDDKIEKLDNNIKDLQKNFDYKFERSREETTSQFKWMVGLIFLMGGLLSTLITLLKLF